jgi:hypothetical protein
VINAEGELRAAERLKDTALVIADHPIALQRRYLQTLLEIGITNSSTIVFPAPIELMRRSAPGSPRPTRRTLAESSRVSGRSLGPNRVC